MNEARLISAAARASGQIKGTLDGANLGHWPSPHHERRWVHQQMREIAAELDSVLEAYLNKRGNE